MDPPFFDCSTSHHLRLFPCLYQTGIEYKPSLEISDHDFEEAPIEYTHQELGQQVWLTVWQTQSRPAPPNGSTKVRYTVHFDP